MKAEPTIGQLGASLVELGFEALEERDTELIIRRFFNRIYRGYSVPVKFRVTEEHLSFLTESQILRDRYSQASPCSIVNSNASEFLLEPVGAVARLLLDDALTESEAIAFGGQDAHIRAIIGTASDDFMGFFRFDAGLIQYLGNRRPKDIVGTNDLCEFYQRPITIRILRRLDSGPSLSADTIAQLADTCLFHLADVANISLQLACGWEPRGERVISSHMGLRLPKGLSFPKSTVKRELVSYFNRAVNGSIPEFQFLGFYHCLEFFFLRVSDEELHNRLRARLVSPTFTASDYDLDRIILEVQTHRSEDNEVSMLVRVLRRFVNSGDLHQFILIHEKSIKRKLYTEKRVILGKEFRAHTLTGEIFDSLSQRIKHIRNEIVHSVDRRKRHGHHWEELERVTAAELPLMRFLAEQIIVSTSEPIPIGPGEAAGS